MTVEYELEISVVLKESGTYLGSDRPLDDFVNHALDQPIKVLIQKGVSRPVEVPAKVKLRRVILTPEED